MRKIDDLRLLFPGCKLLGRTLDLRVALEHSLRFRADSNLQKGSRTSMLAGFGFGE